jgi:AraC-like DNA-binding protein
MLNINQKVRKINIMPKNHDVIKSIEDLEYIAPEYKDYEDAYTMAMDESYPIRYIISGTTKPFPTYKNNRPPTRKHYIFEYVISGKGYIFINEEWHTLKAGNMYIVGKDDARNFYSDPKEPMNKIWCTFSSEYIDSMLVNYGISSGVYTVDVREFFDNIYEIAKSHLSEKEKLFVVADNIHKIILKTAESLESGTSLCTQIEKELTSSIYRNVNLGELAEQLFISRAHLIRVFKQHKGITPYQFLLNEKIKIAKALLATTEMSVKSISDKLCFADEHYFSHLFKEKTGLSPLKYKAKKRMA